MANAWRGKDDKALQLDDMADRLPHSESRRKPQTEAQLRSACETMAATFAAIAKAQPETP